MQKRLLHNQSQLKTSSFDSCFSFSFTENANDTWLWRVNMVLKLERLKGEENGSLSYVGFSIQV